MNNAGCYDLSSKAKYIYDSDQEQQYYMHESNIFRTEKSMSTISNKQKDKLSEMKKSNSFTVNQNLSQQSIKPVSVKVKEQKVADKNKLNDKSYRKCNNLNTNTTSNKTNSFDPNGYNKYSKKKGNKTSTSILSSENVGKTKEKEKEGKNKNKVRSKNIKDYLIMNQTIYQCGNWQQVTKKLICGGEDQLYNQTRFIKSTLKNQQKIERYIKSFLQLLKFDKRQKEQSTHKMENKPKQIIGNQLRNEVQYLNFSSSIFSNLSNKQKLYLYDLLKKQTSSDKFNQLRYKKEAFNDSIRIQNQLHFPETKPLLFITQKNQSEQINDSFTICEEKNSTELKWRNQKLSELILHNSKYEEKLVLLSKNKKCFVEGFKGKTEVFDFRSSQKDIIMVDQQEQNSVSFQIASKNDKQATISQDQIPTKATIEFNEAHLNSGNDISSSSRLQQKNYLAETYQGLADIATKKDETQRFRLEQSFVYDKFLLPKIDFQNMRALPYGHVLATNGIKQFLYQLWDFLVDLQYINTIVKRLKVSYGFAVEEKLQLVRHLLQDQPQQVREVLSKTRFMIEDQIFVQFCKQNKHIEQAESQIERKSLIVFYKLIFDNLNILLCRFQIDYPLGAFHPLENNLNPSGYLIDQETLMIAWQQCLNKILAIEEIGAGRLTLEENGQNQISYESYKKIDEIKQGRMKQLLVGQIKDELWESPVPIFRRAIQEQLITCVENILLKEFFDELAFF